MKFYLALISLLIVGFLNAQPHQCGTIPTQEEIEYLDDKQAERKSFQLKSLNTNVIQIPIVNHIVRRSDGTGGLSTQQLTTAIQNLNTFYAQASIEFVECESVKFIDDSNLYDFNSLEDVNLYSSNNIANTLNIYYFNSISSGNLNLCGYTNLPPGPDRIMMANGCTTSGTTLIHEVGHYLSLFHTHGTSNCGTTDELVSRTNCDNTGDRLCDTPADPNLLYNPGGASCGASWVDANCNYTGNFTDPNGQQYTPQTDNIMSYSRSSCRSIFTQGQFNRAVYSALNDRDYLLCSSGTPCIGSFPYTESFESANTLWSPITTSTSCTGTWTRKSGGTTSSNTGPSSASNGSYYLYTESSSGCSNRTMILEGPCFNLSSLNSPALTFKYHMYGATMGTLQMEVSTNNGSTWTTLWTKTGNQGNSWQTATVSLNNYTSQTALKVRFNGTTGTSYTSDIAIDDISLSGGSGCTLSTNPASSISLNSTATNSSVYVYSTSNWTASDNASWITLNTTSGNGNANLSFSATANTATSSRTGTITINCGGSSTSVLVTQDGVTTTTCVNLFPYNESFESGLGAWIQDTGDNINWTRKSGNTQSSNTGPSSASQGTYYMYTESSSPNFPSKVANLVSPCFNLSSLNNPTFSFKYHMYGATMGTLRVEVSTNNGSTWTTLWTKTGNQGNSWQTATVSLNNYAAQTALKVRFNGTTGTSYTSDIAIDDVSLSGGSAGNCTNTISSFPYLESFESANTLWSPITTSISCTGTWTKRSGGTPSSGTGPSAAHNGSYYLYTESSSGCNNRTMTIEGPCFDLSGMTAANFAFRYHMYGATMGTLHVDASTNGGTSWTTLWSKSGQQNSSNTNPWSSTTLSLNGYLNQTVQLRFRGVTGSSYTSDIAIDYLQVITAMAAPNVPDDNYSNPVIQTTGIDIRNYPNPFNAQTTIEFTLEKDVPVTLFVSDITGKQIAVLLNDKQKNKGTHQAIFEGNNYPAGMYYYTVQAGNYVATQKMTLVK